MSEHAIDKLAPGVKTEKAVRAQAEHTSLPASAHIENTALGAMMLDHRELERGVDRLVAADFAYNANRKIFQAMAFLYEDGQSDINFSLIRAEIERRKELDQVGGPAYIASLTEGVPRNFSIESFIRILKDKTLLRDLYAITANVLGQIAEGKEGKAVLTRLGEQTITLAAQAKVSFHVESKREMFVDAIDYSEQTKAEVDWLVENVIQYGGNGLFLADPGSGKSLVSIHLAMHLITGTSWFGCSIRERTRTAIISREDFHGETARRIAKVRAGSIWKNLDMKGWLYLNTRAQTETFSLQNGADVDEIIDELQRRQIRFAILDVFRRLWEGDENDNREVANVLAALTRIQTEAKCAVALVHHLKKGEGPTIFHRSRGSTAIEGWREWAWGLSVDSTSEPGHDIRKLEFYTKSSSPHRPLYFEIDDGGDRVSLNLRDAPKRPKKAKSAADVVADPPPTMFYDRD